MSQTIFSESVFNYPRLELVFGLFSEMLFVIFILCMWEFLLHVCLDPRVCSDTGQERALGLLEPEFSSAAAPHGVRHSARASSALNQIK